jgi:hypothetical protein
VETVKNVVKDWLSDPLEDFLLGGVEVEKVIVEKDCFALGVPDG